MSSLDTWKKRLYAFCFSFVFPKVHKLDPEQWKKVEVVHIDIANRSQVDTKVRTIEFLLQMRSCGDVYESDLCFDQIAT